MITFRNEKVKVPHQFLQQFNDASEQDTHLRAMLHFYRHLLSLITASVGDLNVRKQNGYLVYGGGV